MQPISERYRRLLGEPEHVRETRVEIGGMGYGQDDIYACAISGSIFQDAAIGGCIARELDLTVRPVAPIPRMAEVAVFTRLVLGDEASEWVPKGLFFIDTRETDEVSGLLTIHGYDAMLRAEAVWLDPSVDAGEWPMSQRAAVEDIARRMGVGIDQRTVIGATYKVDYPNDLTMREVLAEIAASNGGNWSVNGAGELLLAPLGSLPMETGFLVDSEDGGAILFGEVRIFV